MEHAVWKGKMISASEIAEDFEIENSVRVASRNKELRCPDPECKQPLIKYCHGDVKEAYFAHVNHGACDYAAFDKETTPVVKFIQQKLFEHFKSLGYDVDQEIKILPHHYTQLVISFDDGDSLALEIGTQKTTKETADNLRMKYQDKGINFQWIIIGNPNDRVQEDHVCFIKRQQLNLPHNGDLFIIDEEGREVAQARFFNELYIYKNRTMDKEIGQGKAMMESLRITDKSLALGDSDQQLQDWILKQQEKFRKKVDEEIEREKAALQQAELRRKMALEKAQSRKTGSVQKSARNFQNSNAKYKTYDECKREVYPKMRQNQIEVKDSYNHRWRKCIKCGRVSPDEEFADFGDQYGPVRGICWDCYKK